MLPLCHRRAVLLLPVPTSASSELPISHISAVRCHFHLAPGEQGPPLLDQGESLVGFPAFAMTLLSYSLLIPWTH